MDAYAALGPNATLRAVRVGRDARKVWLHCARDDPGYAAAAVLTHSGMKSQPCGDNPTVLDHLPGNAPSSRRAGAAF